MRVLGEAINDGAQAINYLKAEELIKNDQGFGSGANWSIRLLTNPTESYEVHAKVVVSATGAWADNFASKAFAETPPISTSVNSSLSGQSFGY